MNTSHFERLESRQMMSVTLGTNLVVNGDAESLPPPPVEVPGGPPVVPLPGPRIKGWFSTDGFDIARYGEQGKPRSNSPGPAARGVALFGGGLSETAANAADSASAVQDIDLSSIATDVNAGRIRFDFSAYLGGFGFERDNMKATLIFNTGMVTPQPGPSIQGLSPALRKGVTGLTLRSISGDVPAGTRAIRIQLTATKAFGKYIDGYADNVELKLSSSRPMNQGYVTGRVMNDANVNGKLDRGETGLAGAIVYSDRNQNGKFDADEPDTLTNANGAYELLTAPGLNHIRTVPPPGYRGVGAQVRKVTVNGGLTTSGHSFLATRNGVVTGQVFFDWNGNGRRDAADDDEGQELVTVFLDANNNGKLDAGESRAQTDAQGNFRIVAPAGRYTLRQRSSATFFKQSLPAKRKGIVVDLAPGATVKDRVFGLEPIPQ
jgi:hypothetical protein